MGAWRAVLTTNSAFRYPGACTYFRVFSCFVFVCFLFLCSLSRAVGSGWHSGTPTVVVLEDVDELLSAGSVEEMGISGNVSR